LVLWLKVRRPERFGIAADAVDGCLTTCLPPMGCKKQMQTSGALKRPVTHRPQAAQIHGRLHRSPALFQLSFFRGRQVSALAVFA
jgi:hypothetical protein